MNDINEQALDRLIDAFIAEFPDFSGFDAIDGKYIEEERRYKDEFHEQFQSQFIRIVERERPQTDEEARVLLDALRSVLGVRLPSQDGPQNLIGWRSLFHLRDISGQAALRAANALYDLWHSTAAVSQALEGFSKVYVTTLEEFGIDGGPKGIARAIGTLLVAMRDPQEAIFVRTNLWATVVRQLMNEVAFKNQPMVVEEYDRVLVIAQALRRRLSERGFPPKDNWDVYSVVWRAVDAMGTVKPERAPDSPALTASSNVEGIKRPMPTNLILFGPPGTGKTYETISEAVRLCDGELPGEAGDGDFRQAIVQRYRELKERGRIEFITFHQSFSYEEFVEGLRPDTGIDEGEDASAGFRLVPEDGVFRRIAKRAIEAGRSRSPGTTLARTKVFKMSLGATNDPSLAYLYEECIANSYILTGYGGEVDWSDAVYSTWTAIRDRWQQIDPEATSNNPNIVQTYSLRQNMTVGDLVIVSNGNLKFRAIGRVTGPYEFVKRDDDHYYHRRSVEWLWVDDGEGLSHQDIYEKRFSQQTLYQLVDNAIKWPALEQIVMGEASEVSGPAPYVLIIDEINRANVSKVFGELITLLEQDKRLGALNELKVRLPYSKEEFGVPQNLNIIGTMNTADRSIALLDTALRRRFAFRELMPNPGLLSDDVDGIALSSVLGAINDKIEYLFDRDHQVGHAYFMGCQSRSDVDSVMREKIIPLLVEYFYEDWEQVRRVLGETRNVGQFVSRRALAVPAGIDDMAGAEPRWRYSVNPKFGDDAYDQIIA